MGIPVPNLWPGMGWSFWLAGSIFPAGMGEKPCHCLRISSCKAASSLSPVPPVILFVWQLEVPTSYLLDITASSLESPLSSPSLTFVQPISCLILKCLCLHWSYCACKWRKPPQASLHKGVIFVCVCVNQGRELAFGTQGQQNSQASWRSAVRKGRALSKQGSLSPTHWRLLLSFQPCCRPGFSALPGMWAPALNWCAFLRPVLAVDGLERLSPDPTFLGGRNRGCVFIVYPPLVQ